jgi:DNA polymerase-3 subunit alpha
MQLRIYSHYSNFESIIQIPDLVAFCIKNNIKFCAICDRMNIFGAAEFSAVCLKNKIKPVIGCLLNITNIGYIPVYIYNQIGYRNLSFLLSQYYMNQTSIALEELYAYNEGLIVLTGDESVFNDPAQDKIEQLLIDMAKHLGNNLFIEVNLANANNTARLIELSNKHNIPIVTTHTTRCLYKDDLMPLEVFRMIQTGEFYEPGADFIWKDSYYHLTDIVVAELKAGIQNAHAIFVKCCFAIEPQSAIIPRYDLEHDIDIEQVLRHKVLEGLKQRRGVIDDVYKKRVEIELQVLIQKNFCEYFLVTADFVQYAKSIGISVGPGRGSGVGCLIAYCLGITAIDPIEHGLLFERFLNPERSGLPDFDIDFDPERRHEIIEYLTNKYGVYGIAQIITYIVLQARAVVRDVGRVFRIPFNKLNYITSLIPQDQVNPVRLPEALELVADLKKLYTTNKEFQTIFNVALKLEGCVRNFSKHAAGIILSHIPIYERCPLYRDAKGDLVTQYDLKYLETVGLIKFDFLGLKTLTYLQKTVNQIKRTYNVDIDLSMLPINDHKVFELLSTPTTHLPLEGIFQFEGNALNTIMVNLKATEFNDLVALTSLYRPGPIGMIPQYIARKHGKEEIIYLHTDIPEKFLPELKRILQPTYGILVYQEQIMSVVGILADFSLAEADILRRIMGKKKHEEMVLVRDKFVTRCVSNGINQQTASEIFEDISKFSGYAFNKSHAVAYSFIAYQCLYLKVHYINAFTENYLQSESGTENLYKLVKYLYEMINQNYTVFKPNAQYPQKYCKVLDKQLHIGLMEIKNINAQVAESIVKNAPYTNVYQFVQANSTVLNKKSWHGLVHAGVLDDIVIHSDIALKYNDVFYKRHVLLNNFTYIMSMQPVTQEIPEMMLTQYIEESENVLPVPICRANVYASLFRSSQLVCINNMRHNQENVLILATLISIKRKRKKNMVYAFIEVGDHTGIINFSLHDETLTKYNTIMHDGKEFVFEINVYRNRITLHNVYTINDFVSKFKQLYIHVNNIIAVRQLSNYISLIATGKSSGTKVNICFNNAIYTTNGAIEANVDNLYTLWHQTMQQQ